MVHWCALLLTSILICGQQLDSPLPPSTSAADSDSTLPAGPRVLEGDTVCHEGDTATFTCMGGVGGTWSLNDSMLPLLSPNGTYHIITDDSFVLEIICSATTYNHTYVSCRDQKSQQSEKVLLLVLGPRVLEGNTVCHEGDTATFTCMGGVGGTWSLNDSMLPLLSPNGTYHIIMNDSFVLEIICSATAHNHTYVSCRDQKSQQSEKVWLLVQGLLGAVQDLHYHDNNKSLAWKEPFHLYPSENISYMYVVKPISDLSDDSSSDVSDGGTTTNQGDTNADGKGLQRTAMSFINLTDEVDEDSSYNVTVWAVNVVGAGEAAVIKIKTESSGTQSTTEGTQSTTEGVAMEINLPTTLENWIPIATSIIGVITVVVLVGPVAALAMLAMLVLKSRFYKKNSQPLESTITMDTHRDQSQISEQVIDLDSSNAGLVTGTQAPIHQKMMPSRNPLDKEGTSDFRGKMVKIKSWFRNLVQDGLRRRKQSG